MARGLRLGAVFTGVDVPVGLAVVALAAVAALLALSGAIVAGVAERHHSTQGAVAHAWGTSFGARA